MTHPMLPQTSHDEAAEQLFVRDLKVFLAEAIEPQHRNAAATADPGPQSNARVETVYERLHQDESFRAWASLRRTSQDMLWRAVSRSVMRQSAALNATSDAAELGSVTLDPDFAMPRYLADRDVHLMPGGYGADNGGVEQGAIMDRGGAVYMLGRNGGLLNDVRGRTMVSHLFHRSPDIAPRRILELGCGVGASLVPVAQAFPDAQVHGIDVGGAMLRYARARAAHLGVAAHFSQDDAERTRFDDASFDVVFSCALMHETSATAMARILAESRRLLAPGGLAVHLEVPQRYDRLDLWGRIRGAIEADYNNEPAWKDAISADFSTLMLQAGFGDIRIGYQDATQHPHRGNSEFHAESKGVFRSWFVASGSAQ